MRLPWRSWPVLGSLCGARPAELAWWGCASARIRLSCIWYSAVPIACNDGGQKLRTSKCTSMRWNSTLSAPIATFMVFAGQPLSRAAADAFSSTRRSGLPRTGIETGSQIFLEADGDTERVHVTLRDRSPRRARTRAMSPCLSSDGCSLIPEGRAGFSRHRRPTRRCSCTVSQHTH